MNLKFLERGALLIVVLFAVLLPLSNPRVYATDEAQYFAYLRSLRFDGDFDFENEYRELARRNPASGIENLLQPNRFREATGLYGNIAPVGSAIMWSPFYLLADGLVQAANALGAQIPADGYSKPYVLSVCYASATYGLLGLLLCYRLTRRYASQFAAALATITIWLATPLFFYMFVQMPFAHATGFFLVSLFLTIWHETRGGRTEDEGRRTKDEGRRREDGGGRTEDRGPRTEDRGRRTEDEGRRTKDEGRRTEDGGRRTEDESATHHSSLITDHFRSWRAWVVLGVVGGLMTMTREQLGLFLIIPAVEALSQYWRVVVGVKSERGRSDQGRSSVVVRFWSLAGRHVLFLVVFVLTLTPQLVTYQVLNGAPRPAGEVSGRIRWCSPHFMDTLIDYDPSPSAWCYVPNDFTANFPPFAHGAFIWSPVLVPGLLGLALLWRRDRLLGLALALAFLGQTYINGAYGTTWHLTSSFGFRRLIECSPLFILGLALLVDRAAQRIDRRALLVPALLLIGWNAGLAINWAVFNQETGLRQGMNWPELWRWQFELPVKVAGKAGDLLFDRCKFLDNSC